MDDIAIKVENVSKDFLLAHEKVNSLKSVVTNLTKSNPRKAKEKQHALKDISFEVKKGEFFGIVGRNGSGKSTLLKILAGIYQPTAGSVSTSGKLVPFIELGVGFNPELTGRENVYLNGAMLGFSEDEVKSMYDDIVSFAEMGQYMDKKLKNYSSGMQVRLAFSMATRANADILLVDEVLAVGDESFQRKCYQYFKQLKRDKKTVIFVTHDMGAVREFCTKAVLIEESRITDRGSGSEIADLYSRLFLDERVTETKVGKRWGDGKAKISDVKATPTIVKDENKTIQLNWQVQAKSDIDEPLYGFSIKNEEGNPLIGTNSILSKIEASPLKAGQKVMVNWTIDNILPDGKYSVVPAMGSKDNTVHDWWEAATTFEVRRLTRNPYPIQPELSGTIKELK
jgi:ABC-2 type transport system ATP-binding protein